MIGIAFRDALFLEMETDAMVHSNRERGKKVLLILIGAVALLIGGLFYFMFNQNALFVLWIRGWAPFPENVASGRIEEFICNWGADVLWMFSFTIFVQIILWMDSGKALLLTGCTALGALWEFLQYAGLVGGTADFGDLVAYLLGNLCAIVLVRLIVKEKKYE